MEKIVINGIWWFGNKQEESFKGVLTVSNNDIELFLIDCDKYVKGTFNVLGFSNSGKKITLYKCFTSNHTMSSPGFPTAVITANYFFEGDHLSEDDLYFESAVFTFEFLNYWLDISGISSEPNPSDENGVVIKYRNQERIIFFSNEYIKFSFEFEATWPVFRTAHDVNLVQKTKLQIESKQKFSLSQLWEYLFELRSFFTLAFYSLPRIEDLQLIKDNKTIITRYVGEEEYVNKKKTHKRHFLFHYSDIKENFQDIYETWHQLAKKIEPVLNMLVELFGKRNIITENRFLNALQAVESFHRRLRNNKVLSNEEFLKKREEIISAVPKDHQLWLKEKLAFANEPTLKQRLENLFEEIDPAIKKHLFPNVELLIKEARDNRNFYTHYDQSIAQKSLKGRELYILTERYKLLLLILLLKETKIEQNKAYQIIKESSHYLFNHIIVK